MKHTRDWPHVVAVLSDAMDGCDPEAMDVVDLLFSAEPPIRTVTELSARCGQTLPGFTSRLVRGGYPDPKVLVDAVLIVRAAAAAEYGPRSACQVSDAVGWQSKRMLQRMTVRHFGCHASDFARRATLSDALRWFVASIIDPYRSAWEAPGLLRPVDRRAA